MAKGHTRLSASAGQPAAFSIWNLTAPKGKEESLRLLLLRPHQGDLDVSEGLALSPRRITLGPRLATLVLRPRTVLCQLPNNAPVHAHLHAHLDLGVRFALTPLSFRSANRKSHGPINAPCTPRGP